MQKALVLAAMIVSGLLLLLFLLDAILAFPFRQPSLTLDILFILGAGMVFYLAFETYREGV